jgi:hypothetical protein
MSFQEVNGQPNHKYVHIFFKYSKCIPKMTILGFISIKIQLIKSLVGRYKKTLNKSLWSEFHRQNRYAFRIKTAIHLGRKK